MRRTGFTEEHEAFRGMVRDYLAREVVPEYDNWLAARQVPREFFLGLGKLGVIGMALPEEHGGGGQHDFTYNALLSEEAAHAGVSFDSVRVHMDVVVPYFDRYGTPEQRARWLPRICAGELVTAIAMTSPVPAPIWPGSPPPRSGTAITGCSMAPRRSSATEPWPTWSSWSPAPPARTPTAGGV